MHTLTSLNYIVARVFPKGRFQWIFFLVFLAFYLGLAYSIAYPYTIVFDPRIPWDAYMSFDNRSVVLTGGGFERHPLSVYFFQGIRDLALLFSSGNFNAAFRVIIASCSSLATAFSILYVLKYMREVLVLDKWSAGVLTLFFGGFSTTLMLSFTPETYTYTLLFLVGYVYVVGLLNKQDRSISFILLSIGSIFIGGMTVTNIVKVFIPVLFVKNVFKRWNVFVSSILSAIAALSLFVLLYLYRLNFDLERVFSKSMQQYEKFSQPKVTPIFDMIVSWFYGGNILLPPFVVRNYHNGKGFDYKALFLDVFEGYGSYVVLFFLTVLLVWSVIKNWKEKMVQILILMFSVDIVIHCILKFGLHTAYIYGGHFVFVYPLLLGHLMKRYQINTKFSPMLLLGVIALTVFVWLNNTYRMGEFFEFLNLYYKV